jgi:MYXO-CTERM domain-containing protein
MKIRSLSVLAIPSALSLAAAAHAGVYSDATFDLFDNGLDNLDISSVSVSDDGVNLSVAVTTRGFQNWTKYMMYFDTANTGGTSTNAWSRPVDLSGASIEYYVGSWVDQASDNSQLVAWDGAAWNWGGVQVSSNSVSGSTVTWSFSLASMGLSAGQTFSFDVATSGGGNDPGVDHLSRSTPATPGWATASIAGPFLSYTVTPAPGAVALLGVAGLIGARRRR